MSPVRFLEKTTLPAPIIATLITSNSSSDPRSGCSGSESDRRGVGLSLSVRRFSTPDSPSLDEPWRGKCDELTQFCFNSVSSSPPKGSCPLQLHNVPFSYPKKRARCPAPARDEGENRRESAPWPSPQSWPSPRSRSPFSDCTTQPVATTPIWNCSALRKISARRKISRKKCAAGTSRVARIWHMA